MKLNSITKSISAMLKDDNASSYLLGLISDTSYEVIFYSLINGRYVQSNMLAEMGKIPLMELDQFYKNFSDEIKKSKEYKVGKLNIVKIDSSNNITFAYEENNCKTYLIKKQWKMENIK